MGTWAETIKQYRKTYNVYCSFHNDYYRYGQENARTLTSLLLRFDTVGDPTLH
jgi:uncharacterized protein YecE (DUF72 family)